MSANHGTVFADYFAQVLNENEAAEGTYLDLCNVLRPDFGTTNDYGGHAPTYSTVATNVPCKWEAKTGATERLVAEQLRSVVPYEISLGDTVSVKAQDRIQVLTRDAEPQRNFEVKAVMHSPSSETKVLATLEDDAES